MNTKSKSYFTLFSLLLVLLVSAAEARRQAAPVSFQSKVATGHATICIRFERAAKDVRVTTWGTGVLSAELSQEVLVREQVRAGEEIEVELHFKEPASPASLAVSVVGNFRGRVVNKVTSFSVGPEPIRRERPKSEENEGVKILPAKTSH